MRHKLAVFLLVAAAVLTRADARSTPAPATGPVEVKVLSLPPTNPPVEVKVVSLPPAPAPTDVRVIGEPKDESGGELVKSTDRLVRATWVLAVLTGGVFVFTAVLARTTSRVARSQSDELARRDKDALAREIHRAAHRLRLDAARTRLLVAHRETRRNTVHALTGRNLVGTGEESASEREDAELERITKRTDDLTAVGIDAFAVLQRLTPIELAKRQWALDADQALADVLRDAAERELETFESERLRLLNEGTAMRAAKMGKNDAHL